jgi:SAM-dependent methyltransferase
MAVINELPRERRFTNTLMKTPTTVCPACAAPGAKQFLAGHCDAIRKIELPFVYYLCQGCRLRFQLVPPTEAIGFFADIQDVAPRTRPAHRREIRCEDDILRKLNKLGAGRRLLDVGSGDGHLLGAARRAGFDCLGTDVSTKLADVARRRSGVDVLVGDLAELSLPALSFDVINLDAVLMYVATPADLMREVARLLRPNGICRIHEFDPDSLAGALHGKRYWVYAPTHVNVWTAKSIAALARRTGLSLYRKLPGTESSLANWLATKPDSSFWARIRESIQFLLRKCRLWNLAIAGDTVYYLKKPAATVPPKQTTVLISDHKECD